MWEEGSRGAPLYPDCLAEKNRFDNRPGWFHNGIRLNPREVLDMATVTVKNIPDDLYDRLKAVVEVNRRSINSKFIVCIEQAVDCRRIDHEKVLESARRLRELTAKHRISNDEFNQAKIEGRL